MKTRLICFAGSTVAIEYGGVRPTRIVDFLYQDIRAVNQVAPCSTCRFTSDASSGELLLYSKERLLQHGKCEGTLAVYLMERTCYHLADRSRGGLLLHAAGLNWHGRGLVFPGQTGTGKSTLAAWLLTRGFRYLTDELIFVPYRANLFQAFSRPLGLKRTARSILQQLLDFERLEGQILSSPRVDLIPPRLLNPQDVLNESSLNLIIFPHYQPDSSFSLSKLSKAQAGLDLMKCLVNARNLLEHGFPEIVRLVQTVPAYRMTYSDFSRLGRSVEALLS